jgi:hypothetical protein
MSICSARCSGLSGQPKRAKFPSAPSLYTLARWLGRAPIAVIEGVRAAEAGELIKRFFRARRDVDPGGCV